MRPPSRALPTGAAPATAMQNTSPTGAASTFSGRVVALAEGSSGGMGLWVIGPDLRWTEAAETPGATALGTAADGLAVVTPAGIDVRANAAISRAGRVAAAKWAGNSTAAPIVDLGFSPSGKVAVVAADDGGPRYALGVADGNLTALSPAPAQSFTPLVRWLDDRRLLVLSTDDQQVSRLTVIDIAAHTLTPQRAVAGVRVFALSGNRETVALGTDSGIYVVPVAALDGPKTLTPIAILGDSQVVWAMALDVSGTSLFSLSGMVAADGSVVAVKELVYRLASSAWTEVLESPVPFGRAIAQAYIP
jgi:hypothetical protein